MNDLSRKVRLAQQVRRKVEQCAMLHDFPEDLGGLCAEASFALLRVFKANGYKAQVACLVADQLDEPPSIGHCWVVSDGIAFDITATQFGRRSKVYLPKSLEKYKKWISRCVGVGGQEYISSLKMTSPLFTEKPKIAWRVQHILSL